MKKVGVFFVLCFCLSFWLSGNACAQENNRTSKLGRGISNFFTGWVELPKSVYNTSQEQNLSTGLTLGLAKGLGMAIVRTGAGLYEAATFPFPLPSGYEPLMKPEFVFDESSGGTQQDAAPTTADQDHTTTVPAHE